jgi:monoamine oxidase
MAPEPGTERSDVVVVGAGFSGLAATRTLLAGGIGTVLLEARDRVGGRCENAALPGNHDGWTLDLGAGWTGSGQHRLHALASEFGVELVEPYLEGDSITVLGGRRVDIADEHFGELVAIDHDLAAIAATIPGDRPWDAPEAPALDATSFGSWLSSRPLSDVVIDLVRLCYEGFFCADLDQISLLHAAYFSSIKGGFLDLVGGKDTHRLHGGTFGLAQQFARSLGEVIRYGLPVTRITQDDVGVVVETPDLRIVTHHVIVALAPSLAASIDFVPPLPAQRDLIHRQLEFGTGYKVHAVYETPFWRSSGLSGSLLDATLAISGSVDVTPPIGTPGVILGYGNSEWAQHKAMTFDKRRTLFLEAIATHLGPEALTPIHYEEKLWESDPWSRGDLAVFPIGFWTSLGRHLREPVGRIHWAGTETATEFPNEIEGALSAGERAANEVLAAL